MKRYLVVVCSNLFLSIFCLSQTVDSSYLPLVLIDTDSQSIPDEPKITARMKIIDNGVGELNRIDADSFAYDGFIGIERRGQTSQLFFPKIGYGIETRDAMGEDLNVAIMGMPEEADWVIHSPYSDKSLIRNALAYQLAGEIMVYAPRVRMAELFLNGDYRGVILWTEKIKRDKNRVDISRLTPDENDDENITGGYILRFDKNEPEEVAWISPYNPSLFGDQRTRFIYHYPKREDISFQQLTYIRNYITQFEHALMSPNYMDPVDGYEPYIDIESFVQTVIINELTRNVDGYRLSTYMYKDKGGKLAMGPTWDHNLSFGNADYCNGSSITGWAIDFNDVCPQDFWINHFWWERLMSDNRFRQKVKDLWQDLRKDKFSDENLIQMIDDLVESLRGASSRNFVRWPVIGQYVWPNNFVGTSYLSEINYLKDWLTDRAGWLDGAFRGLTTSTHDLTEGMEIVVYPNPTSGPLIIMSNTQNVHAQFFDLTGQLIYSGTLQKGENSVDLSIIPRGPIWYRMLRDGAELKVGNLIVIRNP